MRQFFKRSKGENPDFVQVWIIGYCPHRGRWKPRRRVLCLGEHLSRGDTQMLCTLELFLVDYLFAEILLKFLWPMSKQRSVLFVWSQASYFEPHVERGLKEDIPKGGSTHGRVPGTLWRLGIYPRDQRVLGARA